MYCKFNTQKQTKPVHLSKFGLGEGKTLANINKLIHKNEFSGK